MFNWRFQSLGTKFPRKLTPVDERDYSRFKKTWERVLQDLERETDLLEARDGSVVIATFHDAYMVRNDGKLRSDAKNPKYPGIVIRFDVPSEDRKRWAPMSFECDQFFEWKANVQAIAGALEALRKIDRYGVSSRGKGKAHYEGYKALPSAEGKATTRDDAAAFLATHSGFNRADIMNSPQTRVEAYKKAVQSLHPDRGGKHEDFLKLQDAIKVLNEAIQL